MSDQPELCLELRSNPCYLCGTRELVAQVAKRVGFPDPQCAQCARGTECDCIRRISPQRVIDLLER